MVDDKPALAPWLRDIPIDGHVHLTPSGVGVIRTEPKKGRQPEYVADESRG